MPLTRRALGISVAAAAAAAALVSVVPAMSAKPRMHLPAGLWRSRSTAELIAIGDKVCRRYTSYGRGVALVRETPITDFEDELVSARLDDGGGLELETWAALNRFQYERVNGWPEGFRLDEEVGWSTDPGLTVDAFFEVLAGHFAFAAERGVDWAALRAECDAVVARDPNSTDILFDALAATLWRLEDGHGSLKGEERDADSRPWEPRLYEAWHAVGGRHGDDRFSKDWLDHIRHHILAGEGRTAARDYVAWGRLRSGVGYMALMVCEGLSEDEGARADVAVATSVFDRVIKDLEGSRGIIVDLRFNEGGWDRVSLALAARFANEEQPVFTKQSVRSGVELQPQTITVRPAEGRRFAGPVAVLTSDATLSAAEVATLALRALPNTRSFGVATYGALSDPYAYRLPNGWKGKISNEIYRAADGLVFENVGIPPDQITPKVSSTAYWETADATLKAAEAWLLAR